jgi:TRAP transporter 4TM/12TM fusion protein
VKKKKIFIPKDGRELSEITSRIPQSWTRYLVPSIAILWVLFQLSTASFLILDAVKTRSIHLAFALLIVFLNTPAFKKPHGPHFLWTKLTLPAFDIIIGIIGFICALYLIIDYEGIALRSGLPYMRDIIFGCILIIILLEAARRVIGPALSLVSICLILYAFFAPYMPSFIAAKGVSFSVLISQTSLTSEGIYGIPLDVSAKVVFLFVLFGSMLSKAGGGSYFIKLALALVGKYKGGPAKAAIIGSGLTGMVSGSSIANIVTTGTFTIPLMKKVGYPPTKAAAIEVAASTDGQLAPPIMGAAAFIIAEYLAVPYVDVVKSAFVPAFASYATLFFITHLEATKLGLKGLAKADVPAFFKVLFEGVYFLIPVFFLVYNLVVLRHSPERAAFSAIQIMLIIMLIKPMVRTRFRKGSRWMAFKKGIRSILSSFVEGAKNMVSVALATAAAGIIVAVVSLGLGGLITQIVEYLSFGNIFLMLAITGLASLIIGMGLPTTATYIVMASLTAPAIVQLGGLYGFAIPLMAAHLFCFYFGILADDTPPVGLAAYAAAAIAKSPPIPTGVQGFLYDIRTAVIAFFFIFNSELILHNVNSIPLAVYIFISACLGSFSFAAFTHNFFAAKSNFLEGAGLLLCTFLFMIPGRIAGFAGIAQEYKYLIHIPAVLIYLSIYFAQKRRIKQS